MISTTICKRTILSFFSVLIVVLIFCSSDKKNGSIPARMQIREVMPVLQFQNSIDPSVPIMSDSESTPIKGHQTKVKQKEVIERELKVQKSVPAPMPLPSRPLYEKTLIFTITPPLNREEVMDTLRTMIGSFHQYREGHGKIPQFVIFIVGPIIDTPNAVYEELSWWENVKFHNLEKYLGISHANYVNSDSVLIESLMERLIKENPSVTSIWWTKFGNVYDPLRESLEAWKGSDKELVDLLQKGRNVLEEASEQVGRMYSCITARQHRVEDQLVDEDGMPPNNPIVLFACSSKIKKVLSVAELSSGLSIGELGFKGDDSNSAICYIDIKDSIPATNSLLSTSIVLTSELLTNEKNADFRQKVAIGIPTTSRDTEADEGLVLMHFLLPSLLRTLTKEEIGSYLLTIYIGIDNMDPMITSNDIRTKMVENVQSMIGEFPVKVEFILLPNGHRVAHIWNILFERAMSDDNQYFYQVNDDLIVLSLGWLSYFVTKLKEQDDIGVVGPVDTFFDFQCKLLTQAMDWQSDTWLTLVYMYPHGLMHCASNYLVKNGGKSSRYHPCMLRTFGIYVEEGKRRLRQYLDSMHK